MTPLRGVFLIWGTPLFPSFTWGRGNNSNLACLSPEENTCAQHGFSFRESRFFHLILGGIMTKKLCYKVGTHVGTEYAYAYTVRQALWLVFQRLKGRGSRLSWQQCYDEWTIAPA